MRRSIIPALTALAALGACQQPATVSEPETPAAPDASATPGEELPPVPIAATTLESDEVYNSSKSNHCCVQTGFKLLWLR